MSKNEQQKKNNSEVDLTKLENYRLALFIKNMTTEYKALATSYRALAYGDCYSQNGHDVRDLSNEAKNNTEKRIVEAKNILLERIDLLIRLKYNHNLFLIYETLVKDVNSTTYHFGVQELIAHISHHLLKQQ